MLMKSQKYYNQHYLLIWFIFNTAFICAQTNNVLLNVIPPNKHLNFSLHKKTNQQNMSSKFILPIYIIILSFIFFKKKIFSCFILLKLSFIF